MAIHTGGVRMDAILPPHIIGPAPKGERMQHEPTPIIPARRCQVCKSPLKQHEHEVCDSCLVLKKSAANMRTAERDRLAAENAELREEVSYWKQGNIRNANELSAANTSGICPWTWMYGFMSRIKRWVAQTMLAWERKANGTRYCSELKAILHRWSNL